MTEKRLPILYECKEYCCGCGACCTICPNSALTMLEDEEGFEYPNIDTDKCVRCYRCLNVCPVKVFAKDGLENVPNTV